MTILVVDDDATVLESCVRVLEAEGHVVATAASSVLALESLERRRPDLVLVDMKMPVHDGMELICAIGRTAPAIPIVAMSGYTTDRTIDEALRCGARCFVAKPFSPEELTQAITRAIRKEG